MQNCTLPEASYWKNYSDPSEDITIVWNNTINTYKAIPMQTAMSAYFFASAETILAELTSPRARWLWACKWFAWIMISMDILISYKTIDDLKQETITDREILLKMKSFPKQRFVTMSDNNWNLKYGYINNKKHSFTSNYMEWHFALYHHFSLIKGPNYIAPRYYNNGLVQFNVQNNIYLFIFFFI